MEIYLVQHGESRSEVEDPERPLTDRGRAEAESIARYVASSGVKVSQIFHSGRLRAKQQDGWHSLPGQEGWRLVYRLGSHSTDCLANR